MTIELVNPEQYARTYDWKGVGCKSYDRAKIIKALILKPTYQFKTTITLIEQLKASPTLRRLCDGKVYPIFHRKMRQKKYQED